MAKAYMERIEALRQQYLNTRVDMDVYKNISHSGKVSNDFSLFGRF